MLLFFIATIVPQPEVLLISVFFSAISKISIIGKIN